MNKRLALVSAILLAAIVIAVVGATAALRFIGGGTFGAGGSPISEADVQRSLAAASRTATTSPGSPPSTQPASPHPSGTSGGQVPKTGSHSFSGNTVFASCSGSQARLTSWIPGGGFSVDGASQGPARSVWVKFKSASTEITVTVTCAAGGPQFTRSLDERRGGGDGGGGRGRGGGGGGGSGR